MPKATPVSNPDPDPRKEDLFEQELNGAKVMVAHMQVPIDKLFADDNYQRALSEARSAEIARDWSDAAAGLVTLSLRSNGMYAIIDGDHRARGAAIRREKAIWAEVFFDLTAEQEAWLFDIRNTKRKHLQPLAAFKAKLAHNDPAATEINRIVEEMGYSIVRGTGQAFAKRSGKDFMAVSALTNVYNWGVLRETLELIRLAWPNHPRATEASFIRAVGTIAFHHYKRLDQGRWRERMELVPPQALIAEARAMKVSLGKTEYGFISQLIVREYNKRLQHKLEEEVEVPNPGKLSGQRGKGRKEGPKA